MPRRLISIAVLGTLVSAGVSVALTEGRSPATMAITLVTAVMVLLVAAPRRHRHSSDSLAELDSRIDAAARQRLDMRMRAETAGRFREEFVAAVRHELKTPLNAILGFTQVLLDEIDGPLSPQQREDVVAIRQAGLYLSELVDAVLAEWVPDRATPVPLAPVDLATLVREVGRLLQGQAKKGVQVVVDVAPDLPKPLGDARRLRQVLINLGTNALRATSRGSVLLGAAPHAEGVLVTVRDTGTGLEPEAIPTLFEEFSQAGPTSGHRGGSGLGLTLTRDLVEWHGGRIEVDSKLCEGSTFTVVLPLEPD